eukprot:TRINITY_DN12527_c0_g1_i2.p1 TRINITY_DN12527_c0_g1~~TRINITY_DN12527_c0_g1_i2.p1  ORF type:complete len:373 (+),score=30.63 TRINITY_DN12527_c0_g1_i2:152-1270(+)
MGLHKGYSHLLGFSPVQKVKCLKSQIESNKIWAVEASGLAYSATNAQFGRSITQAKTEYIGHLYDKKPLTTAARSRIQDAVFECLQSLRNLAIVTAASKMIIVFEGKHPLKQGTSEKRHSRRDPRPSDCFFKMLHAQLSKDPLFDFVFAPNDADAQLAAKGSDYIIVPSGDSDMLLYPTTPHRLILAAHWTESILSGFIWTGEFNKCKIGSVSTSGWTYLHWTAFYALCGTDYSSFVNVGPKNAAKLVHDHVVSATTFSDGLTQLDAHLRQQGIQPNAQKTCTSVRAGVMAFFLQWVQLGDVVVRYQEGSVNGPIPQELCVGHQHAQSRRGRMWVTETAGLWHCRRPAHALCQQTMSVKPCRNIRMQCRGYL